MNKLILICLCLSGCIYAPCQKTLSDEEIDKLISDIEKSENVGVVKDYHPIQTWTPEKGDYVDSAYFVYTFERPSKKLRKVTYTFPSHSIDETFYFHRNVLVAAKIVDHSEFTSWKNSVHYFNQLKRPAKTGPILRSSDSQSKSDVTKELLLDAYTNLDYYNHTLKKRL